MERWSSSGDATLELEGATGMGSVTRADGENGSSLLVGNVEDPDKDALCSEDA